MQVMTENKVVPKLRFREFNGEWMIVKLGSIVRVMTDYVASGSFESLRLNVNVYNEPNYATYVRLTDLRKELKGQQLRFVDKDSYDFLSKSNLFGGEILLANIGANVGDSYMMPFNFGLATIAPNMIVLRENLEFFYSKYLFYFLNTFVGRKSINTAISGSGQPKINKTDLKQIKVTIPSLPEQQKIASFLSAVDKKLQHLTKKKDLLEEYKKGVMQKIFSQELRFKDENGNNFPDWEEKKLGELCEFAKSGGTPKSTNKEYYNGNIPFLSIRDITKQGKYLNYATKSISEEGVSNSSSWIVPINTIIYSMYASVGFVAINKIPIATSQAVINLGIKSNCNTEFIYYNLVEIKNIIHRFIETGTQGNLNAQTVKNLKLELPCLKEQEKIADFLSAIDKKIELVSTQIENTKAFKKGLLHQMFV